MSRPRTRPSGAAARSIVLAVLVAACGPTVRPIATATTTPTPPPTATPVPSSRPFVATAYPAGGAAPCGQAKAPDAQHAPYAGNLKRISATDPTTVVFELCGPDVAFPSKIAAPAFAINDAGWLESHIDAGGGGDQEIVSDVNGTGPYRLEPGTAAPRSAWPATTRTGAPLPGTSA